MSSDENSSAPPPTPKLARASLQVQTQHSAVMGIDNLLSPSPPARSPSAFVRTQYPASSSPNSPHHGGLRRRSTIPDLRSGIRHPRHSTPVLDNETEEDGETGTFEEMMGDDDDGWTRALRPYASSVPSPGTRIHAASDPLPSVDPMSTSVSHTQQDQAQSPPYSPSPTPSLVHSDEVFEENEVIVYDKVPPSESVAVLNRGGQHSPRVQPWVYGSMRGRYLEYTKGDLKKQQQSIREREVEKPGLSRKPENLLEEHDTSKHWDIKFADSKKQRARSCTWLNKMWGPSIDWRPRNGPHPSSTGRLNMQYQGRSSGPIYAPTRHSSHDSGIGETSGLPASRRSSIDSGVGDTNGLPPWKKRPSIDNVPGESPVKKPRLRLTVRPPPPSSPREPPLDYPGSPPDSDSDSESPRTADGPTECNNCLVQDEHSDLFDEIDDPRDYAADDDIVVTTTEVDHDDEPRETLEWRIQGLRWIEYLVAYDGADTWRSTTSLRGDGWDLNMNDFWQSSPRNKLWVKFALIPPLYGIAPGIMKLTVTRTFIESYRTLRFDVQEYGNILGNDWRKASELGAE
ncbi:hypothetical protein LTS10_008576 [Elasticomyces elasticus]|nr:hypothetical protein LTS10_008576 [Elasticomyces elasticus]